MENQIICVIFAFIVIYILFYFMNKFFNKSKEHFGIYCGRYNIDKANSQINCNADPECAWVPYTSRDGKLSGWCDEAGQS
jgi:hypothetical protein